MSEDDLKTEYKTLRDRASRIFMDVDDSVHKYCCEHEKALETFRAFKIIDKCNKEQLIHIKERIWLRLKELGKTI